MGGILFVLLENFKQDRRTPSTLGAELIALSRSLAEGRWMRSMWLEANYHDYTLGENTKWESQVAMCAIVDNKPLYDHAKSVNDNNIKDKRHAIEMLIVKEDLRIHNIQIRWVATFQMLGDILIKRGVSVDFLLKVLNWGMFTIIEDKSIRPKNQQGKKKNYFGGVGFLLLFVITPCC